MSGSRKLNGVILVEKPIEACPSCRKKVAPRKMEVLYRSVGKKSSLTTYLLTDVWYCSECSEGFLLSCFQSTVDPFQKAWSATERKLPKPKVPREQLPAKAPVQTAKAPVAPKMGLPYAIPRIQKVVAGHASQCSSCGCLLIQQNIAIAMKSPSHSAPKEVPAEALYCPSCRKWMLLESVYSRLQNRYKPYRIEIDPVPKGKAPPQRQKKHQAAKSELRQARQQTAATAKSRETPSTNMYDRYGVFLPGRASKNRQGYFEE